MFNKGDIVTIIPGTRYFKDYSYTNYRVEEFSSNDHIQTKPTSGGKTMQSHSFTILDIMLVPDPIDSILENLEILEKKYEKA